MAVFTTQIETMIILLQGNLLRKNSNYISVQLYIISPRRLLTCFHVKSEHAVSMSVPETLDALAVALNVGLIGADANPTRKQT